MPKGGDDFAFLGLARQAEMVRAGEVSPTELVGQSLERIDQIDPQLNAFRKVFADKAMLEAEQAEARRSAGDKRPLLGVPIAIKDEIDVAGEINLHGTDAFEQPAKADSEVVRRLREAGAIIVGLTLLPELAICGFTESAPTASPATLGTRSAPRAAQRRLGRGGRRRPGSDRLGRRRRRLDPHPRRLLRPLRPEADPRAASRWRRSSKAGGGWSSKAASAARCSTPRSGSTSSPAARPRRKRRPPPLSPFVESVKESPASCDRLVDGSRRGRSHRQRHRRGQGDDRGRRRLPRHARPRRLASATPTGVGSATRSPPAFSRESRRRSTKCHCRSASNGAPAVSASSAACSRGALRESDRQPPCRDRPRQRALRRHRRPGHAGDGRHRAAGPPLAGPRRSLHRPRDEPLLSLLRALEPPRQRRDVDPLWPRRRRHAAGDPDRRSPRQRVPAPLARRPDRGRAPLGRPSPADLVVGLSLSPGRSWLSLAWARPRLSCRPPGSGPAELAPGQAGARGAPGRLVHGPGRLWPWPRRPGPWGVMRDRRRRVTEGSEVRDGRETSSQRPWEVRFLPCSSWVRGCRSSFVPLQGG